MSSNTFDFNYSNYSAFSPLEQQKKSRLVASLLFMMVVGLHLILALYLLNAPKTEHNTPLVVMEVVMLPLPEPLVKQVAKEPPPAPLPAKKEPIKPKAVIKPPKPIKKTVVVKKPVPAPKPTPTETKEVIFYEAIFNWGSIYAYTIKELLKELQRFNLNYSLN